MKLSTDLLERRLVDDERLIDRISARQLMVLEELDRRQVATGDGCRSLTEWVAASLDVGSEIARSLVQTMRRTADRAVLREALAVGDTGYARVEALSRIPEEVSLLPHLVGFAAKRRNGNASPPRTSTAPPTTVSWSSNLHWTNHGGNCGEALMAHRGL